MKFVPPWSQAIELADLKVKFSPILPFISKRAILAIFEPESKIVLLKILIGSSSSQDTLYYDTVERSLLRGGLIRSQHSAFTQLIDYRWTTFGLVTLNEYIPNSFSLTRLRCLHPNQLINFFIRLCDAISHIHFNSSFHGDISLSNVIINNQDGIYVVDYDFADPVPVIFRTSYSTQSKYWITLEARQTADIKALEHIIIKLLTSNTHRDCKLSDETTNDAIRLLRRIKQLSGETSPLSRLQRLQAILREF